MKKLFISCPMKGRTEENIKNSMERMHKIAEIVFDQELEVIDSYIPEAAPVDLNNKRIWYLGESIKMMAEADYFIGIDWCDFYKGCSIERDVANRYGIESTYVELYKMMPDAVAVMREEEEKIWANETYSPVMH